MMATLPPERNVRFVLRRNHDTSALTRMSISPNTNIATSVKGRSFVNLRVSTIVHGIVTGTGTGTGSETDSETESETATEIETGPERLKSPAKLSKNDDHRAAVKAAPIIPVSERVLLQQAWVLPVPWRLWRSRALEVVPKNPKVTIAKNEGTEGDDTIMPAMNRAPTSSRGASSVT